MFRRLRGSEPKKADAAPQYSVLVVSDDLITHSLLFETLSQNHYQVHATSSATQALELLKQIDVLALMIGDFAYPEVDGVDFLKRARTRLGKSTFPPVLFLVDAKDDEIAARKVGAQELMSKPVDPTELLACVSKLIARQKTITAN
jgi:two-component system, chemotaxis family, CheB/CheR fusion protein